MHQSNRTFFWIRHPIPSSNFVQNHFEVEFSNLSTDRIIDTVKRGRFTFITPLATSGTVMSVTALPYKAYEYR